MKYEFKNLKTGKPCCTSDNIKLLCSTNCLPQALAAHEALGAGRTVPGSVSLVTAAAGGPSGPPDPPSLAEACGGKPVPFAPTYIFGRPEPSALVAAGGVPEVPSLSEAIAAARGKGGRR